jgi:PAS domain S-box-containing protein
MSDSLRRLLTAAQQRLHVAEQERARADALLRTIVESAPCAIYAKDRDGRMLLANPRVLDAIGKPWAEVEGRSALEFLDEAQAEIVTGNDLRVMEAGCTEELEEAVGAADGKERVWHSIKAPLRDERGEVLGLVGVSIEITDKKRTEAELKRNSERMEIASQAAGHGFWDLDLDSNTLQWDEQMYRLYGRSKLDGDQPYALWTGSVHHEDIERAERELNDAIAGTRPFDTDFRIVLPAGGIRHMKSLARVIRNEAGRATKVFGLNFDITERREAETASARALQRLNEAQRIGQIGDWEYDLATQKSTWSAQIFEIFGRDPKRGPPRNFAEHAVSYDADSRPVLEEKIARAIESGETQHYDVVVVRPDGGRVPVHATAVPRSDRDGGVVGLYGTIQNVSERKRAELLVRESEHRYRFLADTLPQIIWTATPDGNLDYYNQRWYDYTGMTFEQAKGWGWERVLHPDDLGACADRWIRAYETGCAYEVEYRIRRTSDGAYRWHLARAFPRRNSEGQIIQWVGTCTDIDDQKRAAEDLQQAHATLEVRVSERTAELAVAKENAESANRAKSEFLANMSHEIRTPLNAIIGLGYLLEQTPLGEDQRQFLAKIQFAGRSLLGVVNNVLDLSKIEANAFSLDVENFDLPGLLRDASQMLSPQAGAKGIELSLRPAPDLPRVVAGDVTRLRQVLTNLLNNAIKFTEAGRVVLAVSCSQRGSESIRLRVEVEDTGIGIEPAALGRLFAPFTQADASTTRRFGGTGLGLSIARHLVELMGGEIGVNSRVAEGSTFWFEIPLRLAQHDDAARSEPGTRDRSSHPTDAGSPHTQWLAGVRMLVVDDSDVNLEVARHILEKQGATVITRSDGEAAVDYVRTQHRQLDLVLMDVQMPVLDGHEAARRIRGELNLKTLPIIALTAGALAGERQRALEAGMSDFVSKPFDPQTLILKARGLVERSRGEPVPMQVVVARSDVAAADLPRMPSIDAGIVRQMFGDDLSLFKFVLGRLLAEYADLALPISVPGAASTARARLMARAHKLKGSAGMIGATHLMQLAGAAEEAMLQDLPQEEVAKSLHRLAASLATLREEASPFLEKLPLNATVAIGHSQLVGGQQ